MSGLLGILGRNEMVAQPAEKHEIKQTINTDSREVAEAGSLTDPEPTDSASGSPKRCRRWLCLGFFWEMDILKHTFVSFAF